MADCLNCGKDGGPKSEPCLACRLRQFGEDRRKYFWTPQLISDLREAYKLRRGERAIALDRLVAVTKWPRRAFWSKAIELGICFERRAWSAAEDEFLRMHLGVQRTASIARRLGR